jgi:regulator of sigma E protease
VGIVSFAAETGKLGIIYFLQLLAVISLNLAVINLIPFPALDGGRFLFLLIEKIKGSPIPKGLEAWVNGVGFVLLIFLMVVVTVRDIGRL